MPGQKPYRLALYSDQIISANAKVDQRVMALIGKAHPQIGYIPSAADPTRKYFVPKQAYYAVLGATVGPYCEIDIHYDAGVVSALWECDAIHLSGGPTYHFLYWLRARGLLQPLRDYAANGGVLIGVSAGAIMLTPEIETSALCGDVPHEPIDDLRALALTNFAFLPHLNQIVSPELILQTYANQQGYTVYGCRDGDGIIVDGDSIECIGDLVVAHSSHQNFPAISH
jgi:dipeptidase E